MRWPKEVQIKEVGPRDGLQNESQWVDTDDKVRFINMLSSTGLKQIEYSSFVHPKWIPALKDAREVGRRIVRNPDVTYSALVPNEKGLEHALEAGIDMASVFMSASETHNKKNINKSIDATFPVLKNVVDTAKAEDKRVTGYISTVFDCPFEGRIAIDNVIRVCDQLFELGVDDLSLGDTIGTAVPTDVEALLEALIQRYPNKNMIMHFHDTNGMAVANILTSMQYGVTRFDASIGGLGGCPYAPGAAGNVATNDLHYLFSRMGIQTGIHEERLEETSMFIQDTLEKRLPSRSLSYKMSQRSEEERQAEAAFKEEIHPQRKREILYFFIKNQYDKFRSKDSSKESSE